MTNDWPTTKRDLLRKYCREFTQFINKIPFDEINVEQIRRKDNSKIV